MSNPYVKEVGRVEDIDGQACDIGVDHDAVTVHGFRFSREQFDAFMQLAFRASWEAGANEARMAGESEED